MNTIKIILITLIIFTSSLGFAQQTTFDNIEIGIVEHLGDSINLDLVFKNEKNEDVKLRDLINKPTILTLVYFDCPGLCSPLLDGVSEVVELVDLELGKDYQILTISFNTTDTPEKAKLKKENFLKKRSKEKAANWYYLTGDSASISQVVNTVGFKYKKTGVDFAHAAVITILSPHGKITRYLYGTRFLPFDLKMAIVEAQKGLPRPSINRVLEYCFSYDPEGRHYTFAVTKISGIIILFIAVVLLLVLFLKPKKNSTEEPKVIVDEA